MNTALDLDDIELNAYEREFVGQIRKHGWFHTRVFDPEQREPDFSYTTGIFSSVGFPEIIVFSLPKQISRDILWDIYRDLVDEKFPLSGVKLPGIFGNHQAVLLPVAKGVYKDYLGECRWFYGGDDFPCLQLIWPDPEGRFPWEVGFDPKFALDQPDLSEGGWASQDVDDFNSSRLS